MLRQQVLEQEWSTESRRNHGTRGRHFPKKNGRKPYSSHTHTTRHSNEQMGQMKRRREKWDSRYYEKKKRYKRKEKRGRKREHKNVLKRKLRRKLCFDRRCSSNGKGKKGRRRVRRTATWSKTARDDKAQMCGLATRMICLVAPRASRGRV